MKHKIGKDLYLGGCIVTRSGEPVYVHRADNNVITYSPIEEIHNEKVEELNDSWDLSSPKVGMVNRETKGCVYLSRKPLRAWRQGLTSSNIVPKICPSGRFAFSNANLGYLSKCLKNDYPSFREAYEFSQRIGKPYAFHRKFAVDANTYAVYYKWHIIGSFINGELILASSFCHLEDTLREIIYENP